MAAGGTFRGQRVDGSILYSRGRTMPAATVGFANFSLQPKFRRGSCIVKGKAEKGDLIVILVIC